MFQTVLPKQDSEILALHEDGQSQIWLGTDGSGMMVYNQNTGKWSNVLYRDDNPKGLPSNIIWEIIPGFTDELLVATNNGVALIDLKAWSEDNLQIRSFQHSTGDQHSIGSNYVIHLFRGKDDVFWFGTRFAGISYWDRKAQKFNHFYHRAGENNTLVNNVVLSFEEDQNGNFWIGTTAALNFFNKESGEFQHYENNPRDPNSIPHNRVWQILRSGDRHFWIGAYEGIIRMTVDEQNQSDFEFYKPPSDMVGNKNFASIFELFEDETGLLWIGTYWGLYTFDPISKKFNVFHHNPKDLSSLSSKFVRSIFKDRHGQLWIGTDNGLNLYHPERQNFSRYYHDPNDSTSLNNSTIRCMIEDQKGRLWIGTSGGLNEMLTSSEGDFQFHGLAMEDGLPNETVYTMELDNQGYIWLSTNNGLAKFDPETKKFQNFYEHLGLQSHEFNSGASIKTSDGKFLFGGINGFNYFDPEEVALDKDDYPIVFSDFKVNYRSVLPGSRYCEKHITVGKKVRLESAKDRMFYFEFKVLDILHAKTRQFSYRLFPFEEDWNEAGSNNHAAYTNIPPGDYTFQVRSCDINGNWSTQIGEVEVTIQPAFWQTGWFRLLSLACLVGTIFIFYQWRHRAIYKRQVQLEQTVSKRTTQIRQQKKELEETLFRLKQTQGQLIESEKMASLGQLTAGIAHEINNPINFIRSNAKALELDFEDLNGLLNLVVRLKKEGNPKEQIDQLLEKVSEIDASYLLEEINELVDSINRGGERVTDIVNGLKVYSHKSDDPRQKVDLTKLIDSTITILNHKIKDKHIKLTKKVEKILEVVCHPGKINQVLVNVIDNAIDALSENGTLEITTRRIDENIVVKIEDNGSGMDELTQKRIFEPFFTTKEAGQGTGLGMAISRRIMKKHKGDIHIDSQINQGTTVTLYLPLEQKEKSQTNEIEMDESELKVHS